MSDGCFTALTFAGLGGQDILRLIQQLQVQQSAPATQSSTAAAAPIAQRQGGILAAVQRPEATKTIQVETSAADLSAPMLGMPFRMEAVSGGAPHSSSKVNVSTFETASSGPHGTGRELAETLYDLHVGQPWVKRTAREVMMLLEQQCMAWDASAVSK